MRFAVMRDFNSSIASLFKRSNSLTRSNISGVDNAVKSILSNKAFAPAIFLPTFASVVVPFTEMSTHFCACILVSFKSDSKSVLELSPLVTMFSLLAAKSQERASVTMPDSSIASINKDVGLTRSA